MLYFLNLFIIIAFAIVMAIVLLKDQEIEEFKTWAISIGSIIIILFATIFFIIDTITLVETYSKADATAKIYQQKYDNIIYQLESDMYKENNIGLRDLMVEIESWNKDIIEKKELANDFWFGIYYPDVYEQFEPINLSEYDLN